MKQITLRAVVLRRTNYQEADRILTVLTDTHGKQSVIAKGSRRAKSKLAGGIELFAVNTLSYIQGKSGLHTLTSARVETQCAHISKDIDRAMMGYEFLKIIDRVVAEHAESSEYFDVLVEGLLGLNNEKLSDKLSALWFYLHMLERSGINPELGNDSLGNPLDPAAEYSFDVADMVFTNSKSGMFSQSHIKLLRLVSHMTRAQNLSKLQVDDDIVSICYEVSRRMVEHHLL